MKRILQRIALAVAAVLFLVIFTVGYRMIHPAERPSIVIPTVTDPAGNAYNVYKDKTGEKYVVVTNESGDRFIAETNADNTPRETVRNVSDEVLPGDLPTNSAPGAPTAAPTVPAPPATDPPSAAETQPGQPSAPASPESSGPAPQTETSPEAPQAERYKVEKYRDIFSSGTYQIEFTTNDEELGDTPVVCAVKNGSFVMDTQISGIACKMLYIRNTDKTYLVLNSMRSYCELPEDMFGDDLSGGQLDMMAGIDPSIQNRTIKVEQVTMDGKTLTCESYVSKKDNAVMKYYFDGDTLIQIDSANSDGSVMSTYIKSVTGDVPDSTFEVPRGYRYLNLSWLGGLAGDEGNKK